MKLGSSVSIYVHARGHMRRKVTQLLISLLASFGIGTFLTNDFYSLSSGGREKSKALNMVIKLNNVGGQHCVKISDELTKVCFIIFFCPAIDVDRCGVVIFRTRVIQIRSDMSRKYSVSQFNAENIERVYRGDDHIGIRNGMSRCIN